MSRTYQRALAVGWTVVAITAPSVCRCAWPNSTQRIAAPAQRTWWIASNRPPSPTFG